jgi:aspartyl-tRNA(Asn)/glutamyl-tRNA(Gln) amidotransferase subunit A
MDLPKDFIQYAKDWEAKINAFIELNISEGEASHAGTGKLLFGFPFAVSDNIAVKDMSFTCGSKYLEKLRSPYSASVVQKLEAAGGTVIGKTNIDEFGMGCSPGNSFLKKTKHPWRLDNVEASSVDGAAAAVAAGLVPYALGADAGGSMRQSAAFCGVAGLKPTNGAVSRYGLAAYASSLETIGILADSIDRCRAVFAVICGKDPLDQSSRDIPGGELPKRTKKIGILSPQSIAGVITELTKEDCLPEAEVCRSFEIAKERFAALGYTLFDINFPGIKYAVPAFHTIAAAEASANLARFDGIRYGARYGWAENPDDLIDKARETGFGFEAKLQILLGTHVLRSGFQDRYYNRALRIRTGIKAIFEKVLGDSEWRQQAELDAILMPVFPGRALGKALSPFAQKAAGLCTHFANLTGLPALTFPASVEGDKPGLPVGVQLLGRAYSEGFLLDMAKTYEQLYPFPHPEGFREFWN